MAHEHEPFRKQAVHRVLVPLVALLPFLAQGCGDSGVVDPPPGHQPQVVATVEVSPVADTLIAIGEIRELSAIARDGNGSQIPDVAFTWSSSDESVATVSPAGTVIAVGNGDVDIVAAVAGITGTAALAVVQHVAGVTVTPEAAALTTSGATRQFDAEAVDANGVPVEGVPFVWQSSDPSVATVDTTGLATAKGNGAVTITVAALGVPGNARLTVNQEIVALAFLTEPSDAVAGEAVDPAIRVELRDAGGSRVDDAEVPVTLSLGSSPAGAVLAGTRTVNASGGVAVFSGLSLDRSGEGYTLEAAAADLDVVTSATFAIDPAPASRVAFLSSPEAAVAGAVLAPGVQVAIQDRFGNLVSDAAGPVTLSLAVNPAGGTLAGTTTVAAEQGVATFTDLAIERAGDGYRLGAAAGSLDGALAPPFEVGPAAAERLAFITHPGTAEGQVPFDPAPRVAVQDAFGNVVTDSGAAVTVALSSSPTGDELGGTTTAVAVDGVAIFSDLHLAHPGNGFVLEASGGELTEAASDPFRVGLTFVQLEVSAHTCGVTVAGFAYCWGSNGSGQLGDGTEVPRTTPTAVAGGLTFTHVSTASLHSCGVTTDNEVYCWGSNGNGRLGDGTEIDRNTPTPVDGTHSFVQVSARRQHSCGITTANQAYCWGVNLHGQLGDGTDQPRSVPTLVTGSHDFASVGAGWAHTCGVTTDNVAYCWGSGSNGRLGTGNELNQLTPTEVEGELSFARVRAGTTYSCGVTTDHVAYCWGHNNHGRLGDGTQTQRLAPTAVAGELSFLDVLPSGHAFLGSHTCGATTANVAYCWGSNEQGQIGDGATDEEPRLFPTLVSGGLAFALVSAGHSHSCGITTDNVAYCWGQNNDGRLGDGTTDRQRVPVRVVQ